MTLRYLSERWEVSVLAEGPALPSLQYERKNGSFKAEDGGYRVESKCWRVEAGETEVSMPLIVQSMLGCWYFSLRLCESIDGFKIVE